MNVIREAGLFQGRLGFTRAIVMLEEGCEEFSNIEGLGQIRFPNNNIKAATISACARTRRINPTAEHLKTGQRHRALLTIQH